METLKGNVVTHFSWKSQLCAQLLFVATQDNHTKSKKKKLHHFPTFVKYNRTGNEIFVQKLNGVSHFEQRLSDNVPVPNFWSVSWLLAYSYGQGKACLWVVLGKRSAMGHLYPPHFLTTHRHPLLSSSYLYITRRVHVLYLQKKVWRLDPPTARAFLHWDVSHPTVMVTKCQKISWDCSPQHS